MAEPDSRSLSVPDTSCKKSCSDVENGIANEKKRLPERKGQKAFCCVPLCHNSSRKNPKLHFHSFPKEYKVITSGELAGQNLRQVWVNKIKRDEKERNNFRITKDTLVCSKHFNTEDYRPRTKRNRLYGQPGHSLMLKENAIPTLFLWNNWGGKQPDSCYETTKLLSNQESNLLKASAVILMHNYSLPSTLGAAAKVIQNMRCFIDEMQSNHLWFSLERLGTDSSLIEHYTGFMSYRVIKSFYNKFEMWQQSAQKWSKAHSKDESPEELCQGSNESGLQAFDEFILYQMFVHGGLTEKDLSARFMVPESTVSNLITSWTCALHTFLVSIPVWPTKEHLRKDMLPNALWKAKYANTRVVLECARLKLDSLSSLIFTCQLNTKSSSKSLFQAKKGLVGLAPNGVVIFVSSLMSDLLQNEDVIIESGILDLCDRGDAIVAESSFSLKEECFRRALKLLCLNFQNESEDNFQSFSDVEDSASTPPSNDEVLHLRWNVEQAMERIASNALFVKTPTAFVMRLISKMWVVACLLSNFQGPYSKD